jgi:NAD(P)-dependent dehydrogenase (short-subunit alcohol dehydrogenase family)
MGQWPCYHRPARAEGATVLAVDKARSALDETLARAGDAAARIVPHVCDATSAADVAQMVRICVERFGRVDILVNNVGGSAAGGPNAVLLLASDEARFITGTEIVVDGGMTARCD